MNLFPYIVFASDALSIKQLMFRISYYIINPLIILGFVVATLIFLWGMISFLKSRQVSAEQSSQGKQHMLYGIIGIIIMVSAFAIMQAMATIVGADPRITSEIPSGN
jgi:predicted small integral membrane protein